MCGAGWAGEDCSKKFFKPGQRPPPPSSGTGGASGSVGGSIGGMPSITGLGQGGDNGLGMQGASDDGSDTADAGGSAGGLVASGDGSSSGMQTSAQRMVLSKVSGGMVCGEGGVCSGHGSCNTELAKCDCIMGFFGEVCERQHC